MAHDLNRRDTFKAALLPLIATQPAATPATAQSGGRLVVSLSRSGNTRVLAGALSRRFDAPLVRAAPPRPLARGLRGDGRLGLKNARTGQ